MQTPEKVNSSGIRSIHAEMCTDLLQVYRKLSMEQKPQLRPTCRTNMDVVPPCHVLCGCGYSSTAQARLWVSLVSPQTAIQYWMSTQPLIWSYWVSLVDDVVNRSSSCSKTSGELEVAVGCRSLLALGDVPAHNIPDPRKSVWLQWDQCNWASIEVLFLQWAASLYVCLQGSCDTTFKD